MIVMDFPGPLLLSPLTFLSNTDERDCENIANLHQRVFNDGPPKTITVPDDATAFCSTTSDSILDQKKIDFGAYEDKEGTEEEATSPPTKPKTSNKKTKVANSKTSASKGTPSSSGKKRSASKGATAETPLSRTRSGKRLPPASAGSVSATSSNGGNKKMSKAEMAEARKRARSAFS